MLRLLNKFRSKLSRLTVAVLARPAVSKKPFQVKRLGTDYGGWHFAESRSLEGSKAVFCGAGEDISFDISFASIYGAQVFIIDPTPKAISHVNSVLSRIGDAPESSFIPGGKQEATSYNLSEIRPAQVVLLKYALWNRVCTLKFFAPKNSEHVSHSAVNYQNNYSAETPFIEVNASSISDLIARNVLPHDIEIVKLDIEGAEHEVIADMLDNGTHPNQILVEYDELIVGSLRGIKRFRKTHKRLCDSGYILFFRDGTNYSYARAEYASRKTSEIHLRHQILKKKR